MPSERELLVERTRESADRCEYMDLEETAERVKQAADQIEADGRALVERDAEIERLRGALEMACDLGQNAQFKRRITELEGALREVLSAQDLRPGESVQAGDERITDTYHRARTALAGKGGDQ